MRNDTMRKQLEKDRARLVTLMEDKTAKLEASLAPLRMQVEFIDQTLGNLSELERKHATPGLPFAPSSAADVQS